VARISGGVDVGHRDHPAAQQHGNLVGIDPVVLRLPAVDRLHVKCVPQNEGDLLTGAKVREPVPREDALDGHHDVVAVRGHGAQERCRGRVHVLVRDDLTGLVQDADVQRARVQIDAAVVLMLPS
jgi:hypothetical protein